MPVWNVKQIWLRDEPRHPLWWSTGPCHLWELIYFCAAGNLNRTEGLKTNCWWGSLRRFMKQTVSCEQSHKIRIAFAVDVSRDISNQRGTALDITIMWRFCSFSTCHILKLFVKVSTPLELVHIYCFLWTLTGFNVMNQHNIGQKNIFKICPTTYHLILLS